MIVSVVYVWLMSLGIRNLMSEKLMALVFLIELLFLLCPVIASCISIYFENQ